MANSVAFFYTFILKLQPTMKKITLTIILLFFSFLSFSQDTEAPTTPTNFQLVENILTQPDNITVQWEHATDNVGIAAYELYINGILEDIIAYDGSATIQYASLLGFNNGNYCITLLAKDAAGNASPLTNQACKNVSIVYQNTPRRPYLSGLLNYSGDNKAIEVANLSDQDIDLTDYSLKLSTDGGSAWNTTYTFPANTILQVGETYVIAHSNISICTSEVDEYNSSMTNFDGNDVVGMFKYDILYDVIGEWGNTSTVINNDTYIKRTAMMFIPSTTFDLNNWDSTASNGNCPGDFGFSSLLVLSTEELTVDTFQIYPNPTNGNIVYIETQNNTEISSVKIFDLNGKEVLQQLDPPSQINVQPLQQGMYILQIETDHETITKKLIKQ